MTAGWHRDPTGRSDHRYWNGTSWTDQVSKAGDQSTDPISGDYAPPPATPGRTKKRRVWPWVVGTILVIGFGGCALVVAAVNNAVEELNAEQRQHAISKTQFDTVEFGVTKEALIDQLGKEPEDVQEFASRDINIVSSCIYYNRKGGEFGDRFQFCFDDSGLLDSKNAY